jgi:hypothetical protein
MALIDGLPDPSPKTYPQRGADQYADTRSGVARIEHRALPGPLGLGLQKYEFVRTQVSRLLFEYACCARVIAPLWRIA